MPSKVALGFPRISILNNSVKQVRQYELEDLVDIDADEGKQNNDGRHASRVMTYYKTTVTFNPVSVFLHDVLIIGIHHSGTLSELIIRAIYYLPVLRALRSLTDLWASSDHFMRVLVIGKIRRIFLRLPVRES